MNATTNSAMNAAMKAPARMHRLPWPVRRRFYEQASAQLSNGRGITDVLTDFRKTLLRRRRRKDASAFEAITRRMSDGATLTEAMGDSLTDLERGVLAAGEHVSALPRSMQLILDVREMTSGIRRRIQTTMFSPVTYLLGFWAVLFTLGHSVIPELSLAVPTSRWTGWAAVLYDLGQVATGWYGPAILLAIAGVSAAVWISLPRWTGPGRRFCDRYLLPWIVYREFTGFVWLISFAALVRSGVSNTVALESQMAQGSPWLASRLRPVRLGLRNGLRMDDALRQSGNGFPSEELIDEIGAYVDYTDFAEKIEAVARAYAKNLERQMIFRGLLASALFGGLMYFAFIVLQLGNNDINNLINSSVGSAVGRAMGR